MKKTAFHKFVCLLLVCATLLISGSVTLAWLASGTTVRDFPDDFSGSSESAYFAGGDGSPDDPYIIKNAVHLYNLAWLQYLGYFNMRSGFNNGRAQSYFRLDDNITMTGIVLPPIGTTQYPFIGSFNGNGHTVYGLTTSNLETDFDGRYPSTAEFSDANLLTYCKTGDTTDNRAIKIVGMFGVVGDYNTWITRNYTSGLEVKDYTVTPPTSADEDGNDANILYRAGMSVRSFYISRAKVKTYAAETLVGLAAGFLSAAMKNVGVYYSEIIVGNKNAEGTSVQKTVTEADPVGLVSYGTKVSLYSLVGDYDENIVNWTGTSGDVPTEGGSIDMRTLNRRLTYMYGRGTVTGDVSKSDTFHTNLNASASYYGGKEYDWKDSAARTMYLGDGTLLPLNVDKAAMGLDSWDSGEITLTGGYTSNDYYSKHTTEVVLSSNTGYIVGDAGTAITAGIRKFIDSNSLWYPGIPYSFAGNGLPAETVDGVTYEAGVFNPSRFAMYTVKKGANGSYLTYRIIDGYNSANKDNFLTGETIIAGTLSSSDFARYDTVRENVNAMLAGATAFHGLRFDSSSSSEAVVTTEEGTAYHLTADKKYVKGGINFTVTQNMYVTVVLASGYDNDSNSDNGGTHSLFDLYRVTKNADGTMDETGAVERIEVVYTDDSGAVYYKTNKIDESENAASATEVVDIKTLASNISWGVRVFMRESAFYLEIPVKPGNYFIGNDKSSSSYGAYIMYLDIGANGSGMTPSDKPYSMEGVNYVDREEVADPADFPEYSYVTFVLDAVQNATGEYAYVIFHRDSTDGETGTDGIVRTKVHYKADGMTAAPTGTDTAADTALEEPTYP